jgi:hypothetical protein
MRKNCQAKPPLYAPIGASAGLFLRVASDVGRPEGNGSV